MAHIACVLLPVSIRVMSYASEIRPRPVYLRICTLYSQRTHLLRHVLPVHLLSPSLQQLQLQFLRALLRPLSFQKRLRVL